jgi:Carboxypeptidase regulatory-like domain/TonB dependent receptor
MKTRRLVIGACLLVLASVNSIAQTFRGSIAGSVVDSSGSVVANVTLQATNPETGLRREMVSTSGGEFSFLDLPPGLYDITATHAGFETIKIDRVTIEVGKVTTVKVTLAVASQSQTVEVAADTVTVDSQTSTINEVIPSKAVQDMPLNGRDFTQLVKLAPGVNGGGSINGTRTAQNNWQIDGADNNDNWHNSAAVNQGGVSGVAGTLLPIDSIDQFSVQSNANAEAGRNGGGSINMVIKSGTNALHGTAYYFNRNDALAVNTPFAPAGAPKPKLKNNQFGTSIGGPVWKDKLFYFITYERQKFIVGNGNSATEPSAAWVTQATAVLTRYGIAVNPVSTNLLSFWPAYGRTGPATTNNFFSNADSDNYSDNGIAKIDYVINSRNNIAFRWFVGTGAQTAPVGSPYHDYYQVAPSRMQNYSLVFNNVITPKFVSQTLLGVNYFKQTFNDFNTGFQPVAAGLNTGVTSPSLSGSPDISITGFDEIGLTPPLGRVDTTGHITETASYTTGRHQYRFGGEYRRAVLDVFYQRNARGTFSFDGTQGPWANDPSVSSNLKSLSDFLAGYVSSSSLQVGKMEDTYYSNSFSWFAQDSFKMSSKLTLNYGIRWEYFGPYYDHDNRFSVFLPTKGITFIPNQLSSLYPARYNNFAPRFGFAYSPTTKWVVRGNYGIYYDSPNLNGFGDNRPPNGGATGIIYNPAGSNPIFSTTRGNYTIQYGVPIFGNPQLPPPPYGLFSVDQGFKNASVQNFSLNTQYQLGTGVVLEVGFVGSSSHHLLTTLDVNQAATSTLGTAATRAAQNATRPYYAAFPNYATINEVATGANGNYQGFIASLRTQSYHGVTAKFNYTLGHAQDDASVIRGTNPTNSYNLRFDFGDSNFDVRNTFTSYITYDVPVPSSGPRWLVKGWQLNSLLSFFGGLPFTVYAGTNVSGTFEGKDRVNVVGNPYAGVSHSLTNGYVQWINPAAFAFPANGTFGSEVRNSLRGPGFADVDFSIFKTTDITERIKAQLRIEMFNIFNRTNLPVPNSTLSSGSFGHISDTIGDYNGATGIGAGEPFNVQLGLKIIF